MPDRSWGTIFKTDDVMVTRLMPKPTPDIDKAQANVGLLIPGFRRAYNDKYSPTGQQTANGSQHDGLVFDVPHPGQ